MPLISHQDAGGLDQEEHAFDIDREPKHIRDMYGPGVHARQLLITRRLLEKGGQSRRDRE